MALRDKHAWLGKGACITTRHLAPMLKHLRYNPSSSSGHRTTWAGGAAGWDVTA